MLFMLYAFSVHWMLYSTGRYHDQEEPVSDRDLDLSPSTSERITDYASAWGISPDAAIVKLMDHFKQTTSAPAVDSGDEVRIHALYGGQRADGIYRRSTKCIDIIAGPGAGCTRLKPSPATAEVIKAVNPAVSPARNGWSFWLINQNDQPLQTIR